MRNPESEVEVLPSGMQNDSPSKGAYVQNCFSRKGSWEVRAGFGQVAQFDSTLSTPGLDTTTKQYIRHMGSRAIRSDFGHTQIVSVFTGFVFSGNTEGQSGTWANRYFVSIYDVTTDRRWEEALHVHTSENDGDVLQMEYWRPQYNTNYNDGFESWISSEGDSSNVFFTEYQDTLFFGNLQMGLGRTSRQTSTPPASSRSTTFAGPATDWSTARAARSCGSARRTGSLPHATPTSILPRTRRR